MISNNTNKRRGGVFTAGVTALGLLVTTLYAAGASADTGAGAAILNVVQVTWQDAGGTSYAETATSTVTVTLTAAAPTLSAPADKNGSSGSDLTYSYTITSNANGSDIYTLSAAETLSNLSGATVDIDGAGDGNTRDITLGASVLLTVNDTTDTVTIPAGSETALAVNDKVDINGTTFYIKTVTAGTQASHTNTADDGAAGNTTAETPTSIVLSSTSDLTGAADFATAGVAAGQTINEAYTFNVVVSGTVSAGQSSGTNSVVLTATDGTNPATDTTASTFNLANLGITKEVSTDGTSFAATASAASGDTLTYRITVTNPSTTEAASTVVITDAIADYTTYTAGTAKTNTTAVPYGDAGNTVMTDANAADDGYDFGVTTAGTITYSVGTLAASGTAVLFYQVTID